MKTSEPQIGLQAMLPKIWEMAAGGQIGCQAEARSKPLGHRLLAHPPGCSLWLVSSQDLEMKTWLAGFLACACGMFWLAGFLRSGIWPAGTGHGRWCVKHSVMRHICIQVASEHVNIAALEQGL